MNPNLFIQTEPYKGYKINTYYDDCMDNPIECGSFVGTLWCNHRNYLHLDKELSKLVNLAEEDGKDLEEYLDTESTYWFPIYCYQHGAIALSTSRGGQFSDQWDSGLFGIVTIDEKQASYYKDEEAVYKAVKSSIANLQAYLNGDGYAVEIITPCGDKLEPMFGFLDEDDAIKEAKSNIDFDIKSIDDNYEMIALRNPIEDVRECLSNQYITKEQIIDSIFESLQEEEIRKILFEISKKEKKND